MTTIPKAKRFRIYNEAIRRMENGNHGLSGLCNLFLLIAIDFKYKDVHNYYYIRHYPELHCILDRISNGHTYIDCDDGMRVTSGITKRLNILKEIVANNKTK